jgi:GNAT superfamily N-acetyltransferase
MPNIRTATREDLPAIVRLLAQLNEGVPPAPTDGHRAAFEAAAADTRQRLLVVEQDGAVVGTAVLIVVPNLGRGGLPYALIENVVVDERVRGRGYGAQLLRYIVDEARRAGCYKVALTSRKHRKDAHRFYERLGFTAASEGFRYSLIAD